MISDSARRTLIALQTADEKTPVFVKRLPLTLPPRSNARGKWAKHADTYAEQRRVGVLVGRAARRASPVVAVLTWPLVVRIVREAPRQLDDDGAITAAKSLRDGIADAFGINDRSNLVAWLVDQEKAKAPTVLVEVYVMRGGEP